MEETIILALAIWRLSHLFALEDGPKEIFARLRDRIGVKYDEHSVPYGTNMFAEMIICVWCNSLWISGAIILADIFYGDIVVFDFSVKVLALSAVAIIIERYIVG